MEPADKPTEQSHQELFESYDGLLVAGNCGWKTMRSFQKRLGVGGQGVVYLSERRGVDGFSIPVALKVFSPKPFADRAAYEREMSRLAHVASRVARIQHDHLIDVQNVVRRDGVYVMEMEWVDGYDLRRLLTPHAYQQVRDHVSDQQWKNINNVIVTEGREQPRLRPGTAVAIIRECLAALSALHRHGVVHNDLKPANVMLKRSGNAKIIDIGIAFEIAERPPGLTCTPAYAAPEVLQGEPASPQSDLASLGYILIEVLAGAPPFSGMDFHKLIEAKTDVYDWLPRALPPEEFAFSEPLIRLIRGLVDPNPARRFRSAEEADLSDDGAAAFQRLLVKGDLSSEYETEIRHWIEEVEAEYQVSDPPLDELTDFTLPSTQRYW